MTTVHATLTSPMQRAPAATAEPETQSFTLPQSIARVTLTLTLMVLMSALFASQIYVTFR